MMQQQQHIVQYSYQPKQCTPINTSSDAVDPDAQDQSDDSGTRFADSKLLVVQSMIKQIRNGTPVYRLQLPIFLLEPRSLLERYSDFCNHLDYILRLPSINDPLERFLCVVRFYLSGWYTRPKDIRNPFNPIIGEVFKCQYEHGDSVTQYVAEQVSHHPPSTAFSIINETKGMVLNAYIRPVIRFRGNSLDVSLEGKFVGQIRDPCEDYEVGFPHIIVKGVLVGSLQITLAGPARLSCPRTGYYADFDFKTRGLLKGKHNYVVAQIKHTSMKKPIYTVEGRWDETMYITSHATNERMIFLDVNNSPLSKPTVAPLDAQEECESRRVWQKVAQNIIANNEAEALIEKTNVEETQRAIERVRTVPFTPRLFQQMGEDYYVNKASRIALGSGNR